MVLQFTVFCYCSSYTPKYKEQNVFEKLVPNQRPAFSRLSPTVPQVRSKED